MFTGKNFPRTISIAWIAAAIPSFAATPLPTWFGEANTTHQVFRFTSELSTAPEVDDNPYGNAQVSVNVGSIGDGWQNPAVLSLSGVNDDGAWDVGAGSDGSLSFTLPVAAGTPGPGQFYRVDLMVYAVAYRDLQQIPVFSVVGLAPGDITLEGQGVVVTALPNGAWEYRTWTGTLDNYQSEAITLALTAPNQAVSTIDHVEIFTRYTLVPEPSVPLLALAPLLVWCVRRRRI